MTKTIYAVTCGEYDSYRVLYVCDTKERAEAIVSAWPDRAPRSWDYPPTVEDFDYVDSDFESGTELILQVRMDTETGVELSRLERESPWIVTPPESGGWWGLVGPQMNERVTTLTVHGPDHAEVRKRFDEMLAQLAADPDLRNTRYARF